MPGSHSMTIGELSRRTLLSVRALRYYDEIGLLPPAAVDAATGYRTYEDAQVTTATLIRRLRDLDVPLEGVQAAIAGGPSALADVLARHRAELVARIESDQATLTALDHWITTGAHPMTFAITTTTMPPESVATFRWRGAARDAVLTDVTPWIELAKAVTESGGTFVASIGIANVFDLDGVADLDVGFVTEELVPPGRGYVSRVLDGGEFASVHFDRWAEKPSAYAALATWLETNGRAPRGPSRERGPLPWPAEPRAADAVVVDPSPEGWRTEILLPIT